MKAKEWVKHFLLLSEDSQEFQEAVEKLLVECNEILATRMQNINPRQHSFRNGALERIVNAYREANVKWDAVCHALLIAKRERDGDEAAISWPLVRGFLLVSKVLSSLDDTQLKDVEKAEVFHDYREIAKRLGYENDPIFKVMANMVLEKTHTAVADEIRQINHELTKIRAKVIFSNITMGDINRSVELQERLAYLLSLTLK